MALPFLLPGNYNKTCFCEREGRSFCERILLLMIYFFYIMAKDYTAGVAAEGEVWYDGKMKARSYEDIL